MGRPLHILLGLAVGFMLGGLRCGAQVPPAPKVMISIDWHGRPSPFSGESAEARPRSPEADDLRMTVRDDGEVRYRVSMWKSCVKDEREKCPQDWWMLWDESHERIFSGKLDAAEMDRLRTLLDRIDPRMFEGSALANSGPSLGDIRVSVNRGKREQSLIFLGLFPVRYRDPERPYPLVDLICEAKTIGQQVSKSGSLPGWCNAKPANK
jgi:hypothetical protein